MIKDSVRIFEEAPEWVQFIAIDADNEIWGYSVKPVASLELEHWISSDPGDSSFNSTLLSFYESSILTDWKDTLVARNG